MKNWIVAICLLLLMNPRTAAQPLNLDLDAIERGRKYERFFLDAAARNDVDPRFLWTIAYLETRFQPMLISPKGARGLMQLMPATAERFGVADSHHAQESIEAAARYLRILLKRFAGRADLVLAAYNAGEETVEAYRSGRSIRIGEKLINPRQLNTGGVPPYRETQRYVAMGLRILAALEHSPGFRTVQPAEIATASNEPVRKSILCLSGRDAEEKLSFPPQAASKKAIRRSLSIPFTVE